MTTDTKTRLADLLRRKAKDSPYTKAEFVKWVDDLRALVRQARVWLDDLVQERALVVTERVETVSEVLSGEIHDYALPRLEITAADGSTVEMRPIALRVAGANGRVDLVRNGRLVTLLRDASGQWNILHESTARVRLTPLDEDSFLEALISLLE